MALRAILPRVLILLRQSKSNHPHLHLAPSLHFHPAPAPAQFVFVFVVFLFLFYSLIPPFSQRTIKKKRRGGKKGEKGGGGGKKGGNYIALHLATRTEHNIPRIAIRSEGREEGRKKQGAGQGKGKEEIWKNERWRLNMGDGRYDYTPHYTLRALHTPSSAFFSSSLHLIACIDIEQFDLIPTPIHHHHHTPLPTTYEDKKKITSWLIVWPFFYHFPPPLFYHFRHLLWIGFKRRFIYDEHTHKKHTHGLQSRQLRALQKQRKGTEASSPSSGGWYAIWWYTP